MSDDKRRPKIHASRSIVALCIIWAISSMLTLLLDSIQAENFVQVCMATMMVGIIIHGHSRAEAAIRAAVALAEELAKPRTDDAAHPDASGAQVVQFRRNHHHAS